MRLEIPRALRTLASLTWGLAHPGCCAVREMAAFFLQSGLRSPDTLQSSGLQFDRSGGHVHSACVFSLARWRLACVANNFHTLGVNDVCVPSGASSSGSYGHALMADEVLT